MPKSFTKESLLSLRLPHPYMIIIHGNAKIGCNVTIFHNVTLGCIEQRSSEAPIVKDNVYIGCNSICLGKITIEKNCVIGSASIVLSSTEPNSRIIGLHK